MLPYPLILFCGCVLFVFFCLRTVLALFSWLIDLEKETFLWNRLYRYLHLTGIVAFAKDEVSFAKTKKLPILKSCLVLVLSLVSVLTLYVKFLKIVSFGIRSQPAALPLCFVISAAIVYFLVPFIILGVEAITQYLYRGMQKITESLLYIYLIVLIRWGIS